MNLIRDAISGTENDEGWARFSKVGTHISNQDSFDFRNYGNSRIRRLIEAIGLFELRRDEKNDLKFVRLRAKTKYNAYAYLFLQSLK